MSRYGCAVPPLRLAVCALLLLWLGLTRAQAQVPFVPTPLDVVERMLTLAKVTKGDYLIDLGSGDGRMVIEAARRFGTRGLGVDHDRELVARSTELARRDGVADKVSFVAQDLFETDFSAATVLTMYLLPAVNLKLRPRLLSELKPGTRVVSHDFDLGDWQPDDTVTLYSKEKYGATGGNSTVYLWIVPANLAGRWQWRLEIAGQVLDYELTATQQYQKVQGSVRVAGKAATIQDVSLRGDRVSFSVVTAIKGASVRQTFSGRIVADSIYGDVVLSGARIQGAAEWSAQRSAGASSNLQSSAASPNDSGRAVPSESTSSAAVVAASAR